MRTEAQNKWAEANREKVLAQKKRYNDKKPKEKVNCIDCGIELPNRKKKRCDACKKKEAARVYKEYAEANKEKVAKLRADWFKKNKKRVLKQQKEYRESLK